METMETMEYIGYERASSYYYPLVRIEGEVVGIQCIRSFDAMSNKHLKHVVGELSDVILQQFESSSNYGLCFYACGYDGSAQNDFARHYMVNYGIEVF